MLIFELDLRRTLMQTAIVRVAALSREDAEAKVLGMPDYHRVWSEPEEMETLVEHVQVIDTQEPIFGADHG